MTKADAIAHIKSLGLTKAEIMTLSIKLLTESGVPADVALDTVCGAGSFDRLRDSIWDAANA